MPVTVRSFAKINLGLCIGALRPDGFHDLRTVYQTIALHDVIRVEVKRGAGIEIRCEDPNVPRDASNTCYRVAERAMAALKTRGRVVIGIEKRLPVQGGLGGASANAVAALLALERALRKKLAEPEKLRIAAEVGSDLPLFLIGGTILGVGHGEEVYPLPDLPATICVVATPEIGVSTPKAFADWDLMMAGSPQGLKPISLGEPFGTLRLRSVQAHEAVPFPDSEKSWEGHDLSRAEKRAFKAPASAAGGSAELRSARTGQRPVPTRADPAPTRAEEGAISSKLTATSPSDRMFEVGRAMAAWLSGGSSHRKTQGKTKTGKNLSGVPAGGRGRVESPLLDLVRTGIENDFEQVVFLQYPELREVKDVLVRAGARFASLSGSGSALFGLFGSRTAAAHAVRELRQLKVPALVTTTLTRRQYWKKLQISD
jgi:4-diphosphocytidyl-2-C-methyl-D-erythritol kinase